jgi:hypothetical protein
MITIIGRGHSGTRAISHALTASGYFMGATLNRSGDMLPPEDLYEACRVFAKYVKHDGDNTWDFSALQTMQIDPVFEYLVRRYLKHVLANDEPRGWKLPETTLIYPWIVRMFPEIDYVFWVRDPRDSILAAHLTDDLASFGVPYLKPADANDIHMKRAINWKYQRDIVNATPSPKRRIDIRFEDFVFKHEETMQRLERFLGVPLGRVITRKDAVGRWRMSDVDFGRFGSLFAQEMSEQGYSA